jgi:predicted ATPase
MGVFWNFPAKIHFSDEICKEKRQNHSFISTILRNFGYTELTLHSEMKRKSRFSFAFLSFFRNFAAETHDTTW